jgi:hypothetical protein
VPAPNLGPQYDLAQRLSKLEQLVQALAGNQLGQAFSATQSDGSLGLTIQQNTAGAGSLGTRWYQGPNTARDANTGQHALLLYIGQLFVGGTPIDNGVLLYRANGGQIAALGAGGFEFHDLTSSSTSGGNIVVSTDQASGEGLATPWVALPTPVETGVAYWPHTNGSGVVAQSYFHAQHPKVWWSASCTADAGTSGTVSLTLSNGSQSVTTPNFSAVNGSFTGIDVVLTLPKPFYGQSWSASVNVSASGGGNVYVQTNALSGRQS